VFSLCPARLVSIDAQQAERLPGVHAVVTREHLGPLHPFPNPASCGAESQGAVPVIALEKVRDEGGARGWGGMPAALP